MPLWGAPRKLLISLSPPWERERVRGCPQSISVLKIFEMRCVVAVVASIETFMCLLR
jgi:hypothetical protein